MNPAQESSDYGQELTCVNVIEKSGIMDVVVIDDLLYFAGRGRLYVADISKDPAHPEIIGECRFKGAARQLAVAKGIAYVTARADGVHIFDVKNPRTPKQICHYDCIELATGVEVQGDLLFIAQRQYGVEVVNIADPANPVHLGKVKTGEAQSVDANGPLIYSGDWGVSKLTTISLENPYQPKIIETHDLDGYGDGVCVDGDMLYISTGHHSKHHGAFAKEGDPGFGKGHGLEIFSLENPAQPKFLGRTKFPPLYHRDGYDMWNPVAAGNTVCCADTFNGLYLVDIQNPQQPKTIAHYPQFCVGVAVVDDYIYSASGSKGLKILAAPGLVKRQERRRGTPITVPANRPETPKEYRSYVPNGQVWSVDFLNDYAVVAAGMKGVRIVELWPEIREITTIDTEGFAVHASVWGNRIYVSENTNGLSIWEWNGNGKPECLGRFRHRGGRSVRQTMVYADGKYAVLQIANVFQVLDVSDPTQPRPVTRHKVKIIYGDQMSHGALDSRFACVWGHVLGVQWLDFAAPEKEIVTEKKLVDRYSFFAGIVSVGDQFLCTDRGGYRLVNALDTDFTEKPLHRFDKYFLGKPSVHHNCLVLTSRVGSQVMIVDITDRQNPRKLAYFPTLGNPSTALVRNDALIIPDSYNGLLIYDNFVEALKLDADKKTLIGPKE